MQRTARTTTDNGTGIRGGCVVEDHRVGAFFTNVQVRIPPGRDVRQVAQLALDHVGEQLIGEGFRLAKDGEAADREFILLWGAGWVSLYDQYAEDQGETNGEWARFLSEVIETETISILVHDSDVLDLALFVGGKQHDHYDSNPAFSGKKPSTMKPSARAERWSRVLAPGHDAKELEAVFTCRDTFAEAALAHLAPALGIEHDRIAIGFNYLTRDGEPLPAEGMRVRCRRTKRPSWEKRLTGKPKLGSQWDGVDPSHFPPQPPQTFLEGQAAQLMTETINRGGPGTGLRVEITVESAARSVALDRIEIVRTLPGRHEVSRHPAPLVLVDGGRLVAELPDLELLPGAPPGLDFDGAPTEAFLDVTHAGRLHVNIHGKAVRAGAARVAVTFVPLGNPRGEYRTELDALTTPLSSYLLVLLDASAAASKDHAKDHAIELLDALRPVWPKGTWTAFASDRRLEVGDQIDARGALSDKKVWSALTKALRAMKSRITASCEIARRGGNPMGAGFELDLGRSLAALVVALPANLVAAETVASIVTPIVDGWAREGLVTQAVLARWDAGVYGTTPYESVVGIHGDDAADRAWAERWIRGIGPGALWLGRAIRARAGDVALDGTVALGGSMRIPVEDVGLVERVLEALLPTADQFHEYLQQKR